MSKVRTAITSFAAGILSPRFDGRVDLDFYRKGVKTLMNWIPWPLGAAQNRSGSKYIARTKDDGETRLIPFILGQNEEYAIEVGNGYLRFYEDESQILDNLDFVAVGWFSDTSAYTVSTIDGTTWINRTNTSSNLSGITYGNGLFVAVGLAGDTYAYMATSDDGITWTERENPKNFTLYGVAWSETLGLFCAVGAPDGVDSYLITSPDGTNWTERANPQNFTLLGITYGNGLFVAVGATAGSGEYIITSSNGITWAEQGGPSDIQLFAIVWSDTLSLFCAVGGIGGGDAYIVTSPNGIDWTEQANPGNQTLNGITYGNGLFVAVGNDDGVDAYIITSDNGTDWTERTNDKAFDLNAIAWSEDLELFCAVGDPDGTDAYMATSDDGITWTEITNPTNRILTGIVSRGQTAPAELSSPYLTAELFDIQWETKGNIMYLTHENHPVQQLTRLDTTGDEWSISVGGRMALDEFIMFQEPLADFSVSPSAGITINAVDTGVNNIAEISADAAVFKSGDIGKQIKAGSGIATILYLIGDASATGTSLLVDIESTFDAASYTSGDWELVGGGDFQLNPSAVGTLRGFIDIANNAAIDTMGNLIEESTGRWTVSGSGTNEYYLLNTSAFYPGGEPGASHILEKGVDMFKNNAGVGSLAVGEWAWADNDILGYSTIYVRLTDEVDPDSYQATGGNPSRRHWLLHRLGITPITTAAGSALLASEVGGFVQIQDGLVEITANVDTRTYRGRVIKVLSSADATSSWTLKGKAFSATNGYPGAIAIHEDRLYLAGTDKYPLTFWGSGVGDYDNFVPGTNAGDSLSFTLNAKEASKIVWMISRDILIAGTEGGEWQVGQRGSITTPSSIFARQQTQHGSDIRYPTVAQSNILFVERGNRKLRELTFAFNNDSYKAPDRLLLAEHIAVPKIKQLVYQSRNNSIVWGVLENGEVIGMAYEPFFDVFAWFTMATGMDGGSYFGNDSIESASVISDANGVKELWTIVRRTVTAGEIRTIEIFKNLFDSDTASDARMLDSYIIDTSLSTTVTGLTHLIGDVVTYIIDGDSTKIGQDKVDANGEITVSSTPTINVVAGIPYTSTLQTMRLEGGGERGSSQGQLKRVWEVIVRLYRSMGGKVGTTSDVVKLEAMRGVDTLTSKDIIAKTKQGFDRDGIVTVVQDQPLPITISMMQPEIQENEIE